MKGIRFFGVWLVMLFAISAQAFTLPEQAACRPGKTVSLCLSLESGDSVTAFLAQAESESLSFVRCETGETLKSGYTRSFGEGGKGSFVFAAGNGITPAGEGEAVTFVFSAPDEPGEYTVQVTVSQICGVDGEMTDQAVEKTITVTVDPNAADSPAKDELPSLDETETEGDAAVEEEHETDFPETSTVTISLPAFAGVMSGGNGFLAGVVVTVLLFVVGLGVYACLIRKPGQASKAKHAAPKGQRPKDKK